MCVLAFYKTPAYDIFDSNPLALYRSVNYAFVY